MIFRIILLFLAFMLVLAIFGRLRFPGQARLAQAKCRKCNRYRIGKGPCACERR